MTSTLSDTPEYEKANTESSPAELNIFDDRGDWIRATFMVKLETNFNDHVSMLKYVSEDEQYGDMENPAIDPNVSAIMTETGDTAAIPSVYLGAKFRDTSLGGNDAINPLPQYNADDDIVHPFLQLREADYESGMGRVYSENIDDNQQIMYMSCGVMKFTGLSKFYIDAIEGKLATLMTQGDFFNIETLASIFGAAIGGVAMLPFLPIIYLKKAITAIGDITNLKVSRYYNFKSTMPLYYKFVNSILQNIAVNLNLQDAESGELVEAFSDTDMDIFKMLLKRYEYSKMSNFVDDSLTEGPSNIDKMIEQYLRMKGTEYDKSEGIWDSIMSGFGMGVRESALYVGIRVEKSVGAGESVSNESGPTPLASSLNSRIAANREKSFSLSGGQITEGIIGSFITSVVGVIKGAAEAAGVDGLANVTLGTSYLDIPDVWTNTSFTPMSGSNFKLALRAPYGDKYSYFQSIIVPLAVVLAAALPRATGPNSYTSPFLINAHCRGRFTINCGIIDSISITRGSDQHGWSKGSGLPTCIDVDFSIKDLSPAIFLALNDKAWFNVLGADSTFQAYMGTLSGRGLADSLLAVPRMKRRFAFAKSMLLKNTLNPISLGYSAANSSLGRILSAFVPNSQLSRQ